jgi:acetylornithine deacetylase
MKHQITRLLRDLVALPSINPMGKPAQGDEYYEYKVTTYLEEFFAGIGVPFERQTVAPRRDNIVARFENPGARHTVLWEAHQDTVPVDNMTIDPFGAVVKDGKLYGRGACDIKGGMTAMLATFARLVADKPRGAMNVIMACSVDEEHTFLGVQKLIECGLTGNMAIVAEPTRLKIVHAHKGVARWKLATTGRACHSSAPEQGVNAIYRMGHVVAGIERYAEHLRVSRADPLLGPPTMSVGRIEGGSSVNTVPDVCRIEIDRRVIPGEDPEHAPQQLTDYLRQHCGIDFPIECTPLWISLPALNPDGAASLTAHLGKALDQVLGSHQVITVPYGTDAAPLAMAGIPAVVFGPGDIAQAHTHDEWIDLAEIERASEVLYRFACISP